MWSKKMASEMGRSRQLTSKEDKKGRQEGNHSPAEHSLPGKTSALTVPAGRPEAAPEETGVVGVGGEGTAAHGDTREAPGSDDCRTCRKEACRTLCDHNCGQMCKDYRAKGKNKITVLALQD